jgi:hypothetical protein
VRQPQAPAGPRRDQDERKTIASRLPRGFSHGKVVLYIIMEHLQLKIADILKKGNAPPGSPAGRKIRSKIRIENKVWKKGPAFRGCSPGISPCVSGPESMARPRDYAVRNDAVR